MKTVDVNSANQPAPPTLERKENKKEKVHF